MNIHFEKKKVTSIPTLALTKNDIVQTGFVQTPRTDQAVPDRDNERQELKDTHQDSQRRCSCNIMRVTLNVLSKDGL